MTARIRCSRSSGTAYGAWPKKINSPYRIDERSAEWEKIKCLREMDGLIGGYVPKPDGMRCLLVGIWEENRLLYTGRVSSGPTQKEWRRLHACLQAIPGPCPFFSVPATEKDAVWVEPLLPIRVRFLEYTKEGVMRAPAIIKMPEV